MKKTLTLPRTAAIGSWPALERREKPRQPQARILVGEPPRLAERNLHLATQILKVERQMGRLIAEAASEGEVEALVAQVRKCAFRPHYRHGMNLSEGEQATCDALEAFLGCLAGKSWRL